MVYVLLLLLLLFERDVTWTTVYSGWRDIFQKKSKESKSSLGGDKQAGGAEKKLDSSHPQSHTRLGK